MPGSVIGENAVIEYSIIAEDVNVGENAHIGSSPAKEEDKQITVVGSMINVKANACVKAGSIVDSDVEQNEVRE